MSDDSAYSPDGASANEPAEPAARQMPRWLAVMVVILAVGVAYLGITFHQSSTQLGAQLTEAHQQLEALVTRTTSLENGVSELQAGVSAASERVKLTQDELAKARTQARKIRQEQQKASEQTNAALQAQAQQLESITGEVSGVKGQVQETRVSLEDARSKLDHAIGDLGVQSGLIAKNHDELEDLKRRGEREYSEFNLTRSKQFSRVGAISMRLARADTKRNKYTVTLLVGDKTIEKKDKTLLEPVQFYLPGTRTLLEVVVFEMGKNRVGGYLSAPKYEMASKAPNN
ncbi:MAG: hypothetical protein ACRD35_05990 [Candidatus Acidiferrales bacterium]